ncbi:MAG: hypothetical protein RSB11_06505 [Oscillospiraceae bacterium]
MTKFKPISLLQLVQAILVQIPEINPLYVESVLKGQPVQYFDITDVFKWVRYFEKELYSERK